MAVYYNEIDKYAAQWLRNLIAAGHLPAGDVDERSIVDVRPADLKGYTQCHFFAGIGGWSYALRLAGWGDGRPVWTGSCPCQPFSVAGSGKARSDARHLWPAWFRLIKAVQPAIIFGEQVAGAINCGVTRDKNLQRLQEREAQKHVSEIQWALKRWPTASGKNCQREYEKNWRKTHNEQRKIQRIKHREKDKIYRRKYIERDRGLYLLREIRRRSTKKGLPCDLMNHLDEINHRIAKGVCEMSGIPLRLTQGKMVYNSPSIDRIKPEKGYIYSNIRIVCFAMNMAMSNWGEDVLREIMTNWLEK